MQEKLANYCNLSIFSDPVIEFIFDNNAINEKIILSICTPTKVLIY